MIPAVGYRFWRVDPDDAWTRGRPESPGVQQRTALLLREVTREYAIPPLELHDLVAYASEFGASYKPEPIPPSRHGLGRVRDAFSWRQMRRRLGKAFGG